MENCLFMSPFFFLDCYDLQKSNANNWNVIMLSAMGVESCLLLIFFSFKLMCLKYLLNNKYRIIKLPEFKWLSWWSRGSRKNRLETIQTVKRSEAFGSLVVVERKKGRKRCPWVCFIVKHAYVSELRWLATIFLSSSYKFAEKLPKVSFSHIFSNHFLFLFCSTIATKCVYNFSKRTMQRLLSYINYGRK